MRVLCLSASAVECCSSSEGPPSSALQARTVKLAQIEGGALASFCSDLSLPSPRKQGPPPSRLRSEGKDRRTDGCLEVRQVKAPLV